MSAMIVAPDALAVEVGAQILHAGGNAVDAAVACAFAQGIVDPHNTSIGGYVLVNLHRAGDGPSTSTVMDAPALAGSKSLPNMWVDDTSAPIPTAGGSSSGTGPTSSAIAPSALRERLAGCQRFLSGGERSASAMSWSLPRRSQMPAFRWTAASRPPGRRPLRTRR